MGTSNEFTMQCCTGTGRCSKKVCLAFSLVHISCSKNLVYPAYAEFWIFLDLLVSVNIPVIKIITESLADVWHISFSSDPPYILWWVGIGIAVISIVKLKFRAQTLHQIYEIKCCILLKASLSE